MKATLVSIERITLAHQLSKSLVDIAKERVALATSTEGPLTTEQAIQRWCLAQDEHEKVTKQLLDETLSLHP